MPNELGNPVNNEAVTGMYDAIAQDQKPPVQAANPFGYNPYAGAGATTEVADSPSLGTKAAGAIGDAGDWIGKGVPLAVGSAIAQTWNSLGYLDNAVSNAGLPDDQKLKYEHEHKATDFIGDASDQNTADYYDVHKAGIDLGGFIAGSLVPSTVSIKALNMAQRGLRIGEATGAATGLINNTAERFWLNKAATSITNATGDNLIYSRLGVAGAAFTQNTLEGMAASAGTYAAMNQSPIYDDIHSVGDFLGDALLGSAAFGAVGGLWKAGTFRGAKFLLNGNLDEAGLAIPTTLKDIEAGTGKALIDAAHAESIADSQIGMAIKRGKDGKAVNPDDQILLDALDKRLPSSIDAAEAAGVKTSPLLTSQGNLSITAGDAVDSAYRSASKVINDFKPVTDAELGFSGQAADAVRATQQSILTNTKSSLNTTVSKLLAGMSEDAVGIPLKQALDDLVANGRSADVGYIMRRAKAFSRVDDDTNGAANKMVLSLKNGDVDQKAIHTLGDLGVVKVNKATSVTVGGNRISLKKAAETAEGWRGATPALAQGRYHAEYESLLADKAITDASQTVIKDWDIPKAEAYFRKFNAFRTESDGLLTDSEAAFKLHEMKRNELDKLRGLNEDISTPELEARLNVPEDFWKAPSLDPLTFTNGIDTTALRHIAVEYNYSRSLPNHFELISAAATDVKIQCYTDFQNTLANRILGGEVDYPAINIAGYNGQDKNAGLLTAANPEYGSEASKVAHGGGLTQMVLVKWAQARQLAMLTADTALRKLGDGSKAMTELAGIRYKVTSTKDRLLFKPATGELYKYDDLIAFQDGKLDEAEFKAIYKLQTSEAHGYLESYVKEDLKRVTQKNLGLQGIGKRQIRRYDDGEYSELYFSPPHPDDLRFKVMVKDAEGNVGMLWSDTKSGLSNKVATVRQANPTFQMFSPEDTDAYFQLKGTYEDNLSLRGYTRVDNLLQRQGIMADVAPTSNVDNFINANHTDFARSERKSMDNALFLKYGQQLAELKMTTTNLQADKLGLDKTMKTLFNWTDKNSSWAQFNGLIEKAGDFTGGKAIASIQDFLAANSKTTKANGLSAQEAKDFADSMSVPIFQSPELWTLSKAHTYSGTTQAVLREANSIMRYTVLGIDAFNGIVNQIGQVILLLPEIRAAQAQGMDIPAMSLIADAIKACFGSARKESLNEAVRLGLASKNLFAHMDLMDHYALQVGAKSEGEALAAAKTVTAKAHTFLNTLQTPSAWFEQNTQLIGANIGLRIGAARGHTGAELDAFATTFSKKVNGNYVSAQRPLIFQGILGQAVGLFQTYNFNFFQQATRHAVDGEAKTLALLGALQGSIFGMQSLPGFELANKGVAAWGGEKHDDLLTNTRKLLSKDASDLLLYGSASTLLGANLWTRGDTNPRQVTGIPINPQDLAQFSYYGKLLKGIAGWGDNMLQGGNLKVSTMEAISQANISRPLSGIAEIVMGGRTTSQGTLDNAVGQDLLSYSTALRVMGARPLQEAITSAETYKYGVVKASEQANMNNLARAMRTQMISEGGSISDTSTVDEFAKAYVEHGGHPQGFRKWYLANLAKATTPRAQLFAKQMKESAWAKNYQEAASPQDAEGLSPDPQADPTTEQ